MWTTSGEVDFSVSVRAEEHAEMPQRSPSCPSHEQFPVAD